MSASAHARAAATEIWIKAIFGKRCYGLRIGETEGRIIDVINKRVREHCRRQYTWADIGIESMSDTETGIIRELEQKSRTGPRQFRFKSSEVGHRIRTCRQATTGPVLVDRSDGPARPKKHYCRPRTPRCNLERSNPRRDEGARYRFITVCRLSVC
ncbi:hypothetical protein EVAR_25255_1 [Eumeta japonica]|uniref:Uncharacterized protein n=1 Tax=Eumeta variegata TaxID=151549 RepID=A0A4C1VNZ8_EUMVA|nr:hypothetical protein EVAR_25255_1 [Eumeta japonica]